MALYGTGGIKHLARAASFTETGNWTWVFWAQIPSGAGAGVYFPLRGFGDVSYTNPYILVFIAEFNHVTLELFYGGVFHDSTFVDVDDQWHGYAVTYDSTSHVMTLYTGESALTTVGTLTKDMSTMAFVETDEFSSGDTTTNSGSAQEYDRVFSAKLTPTQILAELASIDAVITASLEADTRIAAQGNLTDSSGNGNDWTATGTFAYLAGPLPPANTTPSTATDLTASLPYTLASLDVQDAPTGTTETAPTCSATMGNEVWFTYTTTTTDVVLSITCNAVLGTGNYAPRLSVWTGTIGSLVQYTLTGNNFCEALGGFYFNLPVAVSTLYYIRVNQPSTTQPLDDTLTLAVDTAPLGVPITNNLMIPDDVVGFPGMVLNQSTGTLIAAKRFPAGECQAALPTGEHCVIYDGGATPNVVGIYDSMLNLVATADYSPSIVRAIASDFGSTFYIAARDGTNATVIHTLDASGNAGATTWTMTDTSHFVYAMAPNRLNTILYFTSQSTSVTYAYDLTNSVDLPDLHAGFGGEVANGSSDGFVDPGGNIWFGFATAASGANGKLRQFSSAGALLQTWTVVDATYTLLDHFTLDANETAVVVWTFNAGSTVARFETLDLVDQTVLESITATVTGTSGGSGAGQWNISNSCPLIVFTAPAVTTSTDPIRRLRRFEIAYDRHLTQFLRRIEFYCQPGTGLVTGQGSDPTLMFRLSKDGGITWSTEQTMSIGAMGDYTKRAYLIGLGSGRHLVGEISCSDPTTFALVDCLADLDGGTS